MVVLIICVYTYYQDNEVILMTRLTTLQKRELAKLLRVPVRYRELKLVLLAYMPKTRYRRLASFEAALESDRVLHRLDLSAETGRTTALYSSVAPDSWSAYQVARALFPSGYFCNMTSIYYHSLTNQVPSRIYVGVETTREKDQLRARAVVLSDHAIFEAFVQPHRVSKHTYRFRENEITITERVGRKCIGVETVRGSNRVCPKGARVTCLERALIDAVVHPQYNGGLGTVIEILRAGLPRVNQRRFLDLYDKLAYVYPYWQAIGFLCEKMGFSGMAAAIARRFTPKNKFYLDHLAKTSWEFDPKWQIHYPKGIL